MHQPNDVSRRHFLGQSLAAAGAAAGAGLTSASDGAEQRKPISSTAVKYRGMPCGMLGDVKVSRVLFGGNLIGGYLHCRDLSYVNQLFRAYADQDKIIETLKIAEDNGVNTVFESGAAEVARYNEKHGGHMQFIPHIKPQSTVEQLETEIKMKLDLGAVALYCWGVQSDVLVRDGQVDRLKRAVELAKKHDVPVGVCGHSLSVPMACEEHKIPCDFYVKTLHTDDYFSATPKHLRKDFMWCGGSEGWHDNMWCIEVEKVVEFFRTVEKPWIAFKVLAAGAIHPRKGFSHAFRSGADFIAVGMFDWQVKENCDLAKRLIAREADRDRPWRA
jgi:hypothetical protein